MRRSYAQFAAQVAALRCGISVGGGPTDVQTAAREQHINLFTSATMTELEDVLDREKFVKRIAQVDCLPNR